MPTQNTALKIKATDFTTWLQEEETRVLYNNDDFKVLPVSPALGELSISPTVPKEFQSIDQYVVKINSPLPGISTRFQALQEWEGYVLSVGETTFSARLLDLTGGDEVEKEEADLLIQDLKDDDRDLLVPDAIFRWSIGYLFIGGSKRRTSQIIFRRLPRWTDEEFNKADQDGKVIASNISWK